MAHYRTVAIPTASDGMHPPGGAFDSTRIGFHQPPWGKGNPSSPPRRKKIGSRGNPSPGIRPYPLPFFSAPFGGQPGRSVFWDSKSQFSIPLLSNRIFQCTEGQRNLFPFYTRFIYTFKLHLLHTFNLHFTFKFWKGIPPPKRLYLNKRILPGKGGGPTLVWMPNPDQELRFRNRVRKGFKGAYLEKIHLTFKLKVYIKPINNII